MRFDFIPFFNPGEIIPWTQTVAMMREQTQIGEDAGFKTVWLTEHHFAHNGYLNATPNPVLMCADLAAHSKKIRVGQAPIVLPDWHPLRVAEDVALLDNMTDGRVDFGVAKGINERTTLQFNINADRRDDKKCYRLFRECLDIVIKAWTEDPFTHKGEFYEFPVPGWHETNRMFLPHDNRYHKDDGEYIGMYVHPRPVQQPHPPVWLMSNAPFTYEFAGRSGYNVIAMSSPKGNLRACWSAYEEAANKTLGKVNLAEKLGMCVVIYVADTMEQAAEVIRPSINKYYELLSGTRPSGEWMKKAYLNKDEELSAEDADKDWFDFLMERNIIWVGTADYVSDKIEEYRDEVNVNHIMLLQQFPGVEYSKILQNMDKFAEHVMPRFNLTE
jgi:alkanesulfonate monooxygenase SsuD/methylene tetrahydromethanopterin reductase-like flavin-dependent oxidoreductase (luciferase family)